MNKKLRFLAYAPLFLMAALTARAYWVFHGQIYNSILSANTNVTMDLTKIPNVQSGMTMVSAQAVYSTATIPSVSFTDGEAATGTILVSSLTGLTSAQATNSVTVAATSVILGQAATGQITITSNTGLTNATLTVNGTVLTNGINWFTGNASSNTAVSLAAAVDAVGGINARAVGSVVTATATVVGTNGNSFTLVSSTPTALTPSSATFSGGRVPPLRTAYLNANGNILQAGYAWQVLPTSSGTATSIANVLSHVAGMSATASGSVVTVTATAPGIFSNSFTLTSSSPSFLTVATPTFTGGRDNASIFINGVGLFAQHEWAVASTSSGTATNIAAAINAKTSLNTLVAASAGASTVFSSATAVGITGNYTLTSSTPTALVVSGMTGGAPSGATLNSSVITATNTYGTAIPVTLTIGSGGVLHPLVNSTAYFATGLSPTTFALSTTSTAAVAGNYITITSSSTQTTPHTFSLAASSYSGTAGLAWFVSNDGVNFLAAPGISSTTITSPSGTASAIWDFGSVGYRYLQLQAAAPSGGGLNLVVTVQGAN